MDCVTPSQPAPIPPGRALDIHEAVRRTDGRLDSADRSPACAIPPADCSPLDGAQERLVCFGGGLVRDDAKLPPMPDLASLPAHEMQTAQLLHARRASLRTLQDNARPPADDHQSASSATGEPAPSAASTRRRRSRSDDAMGTAIGRRASRAAAASAAEPAGSGTPAAQPIPLAVPDVGSETAQRPADATVRGASVRPPRTSRTRQRDRAEPRASDDASVPRPGRR